MRTCMAFVSASEQKMQHYVDVTLNKLANDSTTFNILGETCLLTFTDIENIVTCNTFF